MGGVFRDRTQKKIENGLGCTKLSPRPFSISINGRKFNFSLPAISL
jgi:hypothetical protein